MAECKANSDVRGFVAITRGRVRRAVEAGAPAFLLDYFETAFLPAGYAKDYFDEPFETRVPATKA